MSMAKRAGALLIVAALVLSLSATLAGAKKKHKKKGKKWSSEITLVQPASTEFSGRVDSGLGACRIHRLVTVFYTDPNTGQTLPLSVQRTDQHGRYVVSLTTPAYAGTYHAEVSEQQIRAKKAPQTCKGAASPSLQV
jgi:hypothetical protein